MKKPTEQKIESLANAWTVETMDITARVAASTGEQIPHSSEMSELLTEIRRLRLEMSEFQHSVSLLRDEVTRLRLSQVSRTESRISPFAPIEDAVRIW